MSESDRLTDTDRLTSAIYLLRDLIQERIGLCFNDQEAHRLIAGRLATRLQPNRCDSFLDYYQLLLRSDHASDEWRIVVVALAKSVSSFHRHANYVSALVDVLLPKLLTTAPGPVRIWSAGCATGEEPLSIAMALSDAGWFARVPIEITATDASVQAIEYSAAGLYSDQRIQSLDLQRRTTHFLKEAGGWRVRPELHSRINWRVATLNHESDVADLAGSHVIFCINTLIYFSGHAICKTVEMFAKHMPPGGYLLSDRGDYFEALVLSSRQFDPVRLNGTTMWERRFA